MLRAATIVPTPPPEPMSDIPPQNTHRQVQTTTPDGVTVHVDEGMLDLLQLLWARGIRSEYSCQGDPGDTRAYLMLLHVDGGMALLRLLVATRQQVQPDIMDRMMSLPHNHVTRFHPAYQNKEDAVPRMDQEQWLQQWSSTAECCPFQGGVHLDPTRDRLYFSFPTEYVQPLANAIAQLPDQVQFTDEEQQWLANMEAVYRNQIQQQREVVAAHPYLLMDPENPVGRIFL